MGKDLSNVAQEKKYQTLLKVSCGKALAMKQPKTLADSRKNGPILTISCKKKVHVKLFNLTITKKKSTASCRLAKILTFSHKIHHLVTTLFIAPTYLHQRMKG